jgi:hypothetical protein
MSREESSALTYLGALATGLPVVAQATPVTRWTFEDQAFLVDTSDEEATARAEPSARGALAGAGRGAARPARAAVTSDRT